MKYEFITDLQGLELIEGIETEGEKITIYYTITDEYKKENELCYKHRMYTFDPTQPEGSILREIDQANVRKEME